MLKHVHKSTTTVTTYATGLSVRHTSNVSSRVQGVGPLGYSMTLFQSLATAAGYDPTQGPGSSCTAPHASGQCVVPWAGGTKAVSSVVLISTGVSFAVSLSVILLAFLILL